MILILLILCIPLMYLVIRVYFLYKFQYWKLLGVPHLPPAFPYGHRRMDSRLMAFLIRGHYTALKHAGLPFFGMYIMQTPIVVVTSLELVKSILVKDFKQFADRGVYYNTAADPLSAHLFAIDGDDQWRALRRKLTPTFTSGKMKGMYSTMVEVAQRFDQCLSGMLGDDSTTVVELQDLLGRYTTDIIGTCAFGIECNSLNDPDSEFLRMGQSVFGAPRNSALVSVLIASFPGIARWWGVKVFQEDLTAFFLNVVRETVRHREANGIRHNDFLDILIDLKNQEHDSIGVDEMAAQCFIFFVAGFDTSSITMIFALYELSLNPDVQDRVRNEIEDVLRNHNGQFTYEAVMDMHYVNQVINETLRKYPPFTALHRVLNSAYHVPNTNVVLPGGSTIRIPIYAIHHDPEIYPNPDKFDPNRFAEEESNKRDKCAFLSFGDGPRNCIAQRFGMMQIRVGLVRLLMNYEFSRCNETVVPMVYNLKSMTLGPRGGLYLRLRKR